MGITQGMVMVMVNGKQQAKAVGALPSFCAAIEILVPINEYSNKCTLHTDNIASLQHHSGLLHRCPASH